MLSIEVQKVEKRATNVTYILSRPNNDVLVTLDWLKDQIAEGNYIEENENSEVSNTEYLLISANIIEETADVGGASVECPRKYLGLTDTIKLFWERISW